MAYTAALAGFVAQQPILSVPFVSEDSECYGSKLLQCFYPC